MQAELWAYSPELDRSFTINNETGTITPVTLTEEEREQIFQQHQKEQAIIEVEKQRYEAEEWEAIRREFYDECYRDEPDNYFPDEVS